MGKDFWLTVYDAVPAYRALGRFGNWRVQEERRPNEWFDVSGPYWRWITAERVASDIRTQALNAAQRATRALIGPPEVET